MGRVSATQGDRHVPALLVAKTRNMQPLLNLTGIGRAAQFVAMVNTWRAKMLPE